MAPLRHRCAYQCICVLMAVVICTVVAFDLSPWISDRVARRGIGQTPIGEKYYADTTRIAFGWLADFPPIRYCASTRLLAVDHLKGSYYAKAAVDFQGSLFTGCIAAAKAEPSPRHWGAIDAFVASVFGAPSGAHEWKPDRGECAMLCYGVLCLPDTYVDRYTPSLHCMADYLIARSRAHGTVAYRDSMSSVMFVDTLGMVCPFLAAYGRRFGSHRATELAVHQMEAFTRYGMSPAKFLPAHAYDAAQDNQPLGVYGWGRGTGWYAMGLVDTYAELADSEPAKERLRGYIGSLASTLRGCQRSDGGWGSALTNSRSPFDSSATAAFAYFLTKALSLGALGDGYGVPIASAARKIASVTRTDGQIDFSQGGSFGIGEYNTVYGPSPFTQGLFVRLLSEYPQGPRGESGW